MGGNLAENRRGTGAFLRGERGALAGQTTAIPHSPFALGRSADNDLALPEPLASRRHARLELRAGRWYLIDLDSANGTLVNHQRLSGERALDNGDLITIGETTLLFGVSAAAQGVPQPHAAARRTTPVMAIVAAVVLIALLLAAVLFVSGRLRRSTEPTSAPALPTVELPALPTITLPAAIPTLPPIPTALPSLPTGLPPLPTGLPSLPPLR